MNARQRKKWGGVYVTTQHIFVLRTPSRLDVNTDDTKDVTTVDTTLSRTHEKRVIILVDVSTCEKEMFKKRQNPNRLYCL